MDELHTELQLMEQIKKERWSHAHHLILWHGRRICHSRRPECEKCPVAGLCEYNNKEEKNMFVDVVKIKVKSGKGGDGAVSFHREKYLANGGPDGGDGGRGGEVIFKADKDMRTLLDFRYKRNYSAGDGQNGTGNFKTGKKGEDVVIIVPAGTVVKEAQSGRILADMYSDGEERVILQGGAPGKGNARFATATRQAPNFSQGGGPSREMELKLELKTIADVGLIGFPNVGKSTILSVVTKARPKIANYHFTTLSPNLGVCGVDNYSFVLADIPGLIEGAHEGAAWDMIF